VVSLRRILLAAGLAVLAAPVVAAPFEVQLVTPQVEYGKPVQLVLRGPDRASLKDIKLDALVRDFHVHEKIILEPEENTGRAGLRLRLYPRHTGTITVPALWWGGQSSRATTVAVTSAIDPKNRTPITVFVAHTGKPVWLKQAYTVTVTLQTRDAIVNLKRAAFDQAGFNVYELPVEVGTTRKGMTTRRLGWVIYPLTSGVHTLSLPPIEYIRDGVVTHRFHLPRIRPEVMPLPSYVPVTMPVGRVDVEVARPAGAWITRNRLESLVVRVRGTTLPGQDMRALLRELKSTARLNVYPAKSSRMESVARDVVYSEHTYRTPFVARASGWITLPSLRWHYFDPESGKIQSQTVALGYIVSVPRWLSVIGIACLLGAAVLAGRVVWRRLAQSARCLHHYRTAVQLAQAARTAPQLRAALSEVARAERWPANLSVQQWCDRWARHFPQFDAVLAPLGQLQQGLYGRGTLSLDAVRAALVDACRWRIPLLRLAR
jgi:hypothetical protein